MPSNAPTFLSDAFAKTFLEAPKTCFFLLNASLTPDQLRAAAARIEAGAINAQMPEYLSGFSIDPAHDPHCDR